ncbi:MAG: alpha/beta fold hydrolase [Deltaproteobacteria bacterium]|nr:alpha/beta fold hydrolase [Deltaproteobacteria bacterium]
MPQVTSHGTGIYYETHGDGPAVVFAHGMGGNALSWWQQVPFFVEQGYRAIAFDHRGFFRSPCAPDEFHPGRFPDDLLAILDAEGVERASLVCQSMGGWTGLPTAIRAPERVSALVLCGTPGGLDTEKTREARARLGSRMGSGRVEGNLALAPDYPRHEPAMAFLYDRLNALNPGLEPAALASFGDETAQVREAQLESYGVPTRVISGTEDQLFSPEVLHDVAARIPGADIVDFPGVGHSTYFEAAERFNSVVLEFLRKHA